MSQVESAKQTKSPTLSAIQRAENAVRDALQNYNARLMKLYDRQDNERRGLKNLIAPPSGEMITACRRGSRLLNLIRLELRNAATGEELAARLLTYGDHGLRQLLVNLDDENTAGRMRRLLDDVAAVRTKHNSTTNNARPKKKPRKRKVTPLTDRQRTVLQLRSEGKTHKSIAKLWGITYQAVQNIEKRAKEKQAEIYKAANRAGRASGASLKAKQKLPEDNRGQAIATDDDY